MLKPMDIQNHTLRTSMSGYNKRETDEFLTFIAEDYENILKENRDLQDKITSLSEGIQYYKQMENTLQKALILAEKTSSETQEAAKIQATAVTKEAQENADKIVKEAQENADVLVKKAQENADKVAKEAKESADEIIKDAKAEALNIKTAAKQECDNIKEASLKLLQEYENYRGELKKLVSSQLTFLDNDEFKLDVAVQKEGMFTTPREKFSWNSDDYKSIKAPEAESGFTFIDTE